MGGEQQIGRSGTLNVPGIIGLGWACEIAMNNQKNITKNLALLRDTFEQEILERVPDIITIVGKDTNRLPNVSNLIIEGVEGERFMINVGNQLAFSTGSACSKGKPSHVLRTMGYELSEISNSIRISFSKFNHLDELDKVLELMTNEIKRIRNESFRIRLHTTVI